MGCHTFCLLLELLTPISPKRRPFVWSQGGGGGGGGGGGEGGGGTGRDRESRDRESRDHTRLMQRPLISILAKTAKT